MTTTMTQSTCPRSELARANQGIIWTKWISVHCCCAGKVALPWLRFGFVCVIRKMVGDCSISKAWLWYICLIHTVVIEVHEHLHNGCFRAIQINSSYSCYSYASMSGICRSLTLVTISHIVSCIDCLHITLISLFQMSVWLYALYIQLWYKGTKVTDIRTKVMMRSEVKFHCTYIYVLYIVHIQTKRDLIEHHPCW